MKTLTLLRHGKSVRDDDFPVDIDRPLAMRASKDLAISIDVLRQIEPPVDWMISSTARRARQTAEIVKDGLELANSIIWEQDIYEQGVDSLLAILGEIPDEVEHALVVGHNPTLEQMVSGLCAGSAHHLTNSLPTSGIANLELQIMRWDQVRWGCGTLKLFLRPRLLKYL